MTNSNQLTFFLRTFPCGNMTFFVIFYRFRGKLFIIWEIGSEKGAYLSVGGKYQLSCIPKLLLTTLKRRQPSRFFAWEEKVHTSDLQENCWVLKMLCLNKGGSGQLWRHTQPHTGKHTHQSCPWFKKLYKVLTALRAINQQTHICHNVVCSKVLIVRSRSILMQVRCKKVSLT